MRLSGVGHQQRDFEEFYLSTRDGCLRAVLAVTGDRVLTEDLVAEAYTRAWVSWSSVARHPAPHAWVARTALNTRVSWWRRRRREVALTDQEPPPVVDAAGGLDAVLLHALRRLPTRQREV